MSYKVVLAKESYKFSATHFTVLDANKAERLHGHNYQVAVELEFSRLDSNGMAVEFNQIKPMIKALTEQWDEKILIPTQCPFLSLGKIEIGGCPHLQVQFGSRHYQFPESEVLYLEIVNATTEELARTFADHLLASATLPDSATALHVTILETHGQGSSYRKPLNTAT